MDVHEKINEKERLKGAPKWRLEKKIKHKCRISFECKATDVIDAVRTFAYVTGYWPDSVEELKG